jgi:zinc transport system substrate-binding protein
MNAAAYAKAIGEALAAADPDNAATYMANAEAAGASYLALMPELATTMAPARGVTILPAHDAYRYFFTRFLIVASDGGITDMHDQAPSAARMSELRAQFEGVTPCVLTGPSVDPRLITAIFPDTTPIAADPLGLELEPGADLYPAVLQGMAASVGACAE